MPRKTTSVVLVGRPNVGKSTLFNRMTGSRRAIVAPVAGTTRDTLTRPVSWRGTSFHLFDTGGLYGASEDPLHDLVVQQGQRAIAGADLLVFLVDGREGLASGDETIAQELRQTGLPVILAVNKADDKRTTQGAMEFYQLGFEPLTEISAEHGTGVGDLLDEIVKQAGERGTRIGDRRSGCRECGTGCRSSGRAEAGRDERRHRRTPERRKVVAAQSVAERGARARQRDARNDS